jgi:biopolymer transport protein ExbD
MKFKRHTEIERGLHQIYIAPLLNIIFLLFIFFILTSSFVMQPGIKVNLPKAVTSEVVKYENIEVAISGENVTYLNGKVITIPELTNLIKQAASNSESILIKSDRRASLGRVVEIWDMCRNLGVTQVNIATNQE